LDFGVDLLEAWYRDPNLPGNYHDRLRKLVETG